MKTSADASPPYSHYRRVAGRLAHLLDRLQPTEPAVLGGAALLVGLTSGVGIWLFKEAIRLVEEGAGWLRQAPLGALGPAGVVVVLVVGGLVVGFIRQRWIGVERHHGVAGVMEAAALAGGRLRYGRIPAKSVAAALSIGCGASVGPEDPSVQIGANLGSMFGQWLHLSDDRVRTLTAAGAAGGIAAAFNAPIAGVFFALEIILGELGASAFGVVALASVISSVFTQAVSGAQPAFRVPPYAFNSAWELPLYLGLGLLAGPVAAGYIRLIYAAQDLFHVWRAPEWLKPAAAGLVVGSVALFLPQVLGVGYATIEGILGGELLAPALLLSLLVARLWLTPLSLGGGFQGGVFAPALFLGATLGAAWGGAAGRLFPSLALSPPAFALVGMAAVLAGTVRAPLTAIILLFEMTNDYHIILPLMFATAVSLYVARRLQRDSVYEFGLARRGVRLERGRDVEVLEGITVGEVMEPDTPVLNEMQPIAEAGRWLMQTRRHGLPVVNTAGALSGIFTVQDLERAQSVGAADKRVGDFCTRLLLTAYPDETIGVALRRMATRDIGRLPVVARDDPQRLLGVLRRTDLVRAYEIALARRAALRHQAHAVRLGASSGVEVVEITVETGAPCAYQPISQVRWPRQAVLASIRRGRQLIIPHGDTVLQPGDVVMAVVEEAVGVELIQLCRALAQDD